MTDVLDEFDHVLGRDRNVDSDEMDEIQANQMIEAAIDQYYVQQDKNGMLLFMEVMVARIQQAGEFVVPYITVDSFMSEEQIGKVKVGDTISLDHDVRLKMETVKDAGGKEWIGVFTSSEEMYKGSAGNVQMNQPIESILRLALNWEQVNGIVINPFGKYIQIMRMKGRAKLMKTIKVIGRVIWQTKYKMLMKHQKIYMTMFLRKEIFSANCILSYFGVALMIMI